MNITIQTPEGTYIVPSDKYSQLITWLNVNAVKVGAPQQIKEVQEKFDANQQPILLNEQFN